MEGVISMIEGWILGNKGSVSGIKDTPRLFAASLSRGELSPLLGEPALSLPKGDSGVGFLFALSKYNHPNEKNQ